MHEAKTREGNPQEWRNEGFAEGFSTHLPSKAYVLYIDLVLCEKYLKLSLIVKNAKKKRHMKDQPYTVGEIIIRASDEFVSLFFYEERQQALIFTVYCLW